jgi:hypothetical protein
MYIEQYFNFKGDKVGGGGLDFSKLSGAVSSGSAATTSKVSVGGGSNLASGVCIASQIAGVATGIGSTIAMISDAKKRAQFQEDIEMLSLEKRNELERSIQRASSINERIKILTDAVTAIRVAEVQKKLDRKPKDDTKQLFLIIGGGFAVLLGAVLIKIMIK